MKTQFPVSADYIYSHSISDVLRKTQSYYSLNMNRIDLCEIICRIH